MKRYHVGVFFELPLEVGGGFQQSLTDIIWIRGWATSVDIDVTVFTTLADNVAVLTGLGINAVHLRLSWLDHLFLFARYSGLFDFSQYILRARAPFEKTLINTGVDIVYFTTTSNWNLVLYKLPFAITIFDGCFRDSPEFDEVREFGQFERRDIVWRNACTKAAVVLTNAEELIDVLCRRYAMERDHAICIPFSPSLYVGEQGNSAEDAAILKKYNLEPGYLFYPAQFWSHKNHATILLAMRLLRNEGKNFTLVLCGSDPGARAAFEALVLRYALADSVRILGFVPSAELGALYRYAQALVMATYFGPTNLPPLEAWKAGTPVIYPEAFSAQVGDAAILFDYDDPASLAGAILKVSSNEERKRLADEGRNRLAHFAQRAEEGRRQLSRRLMQLRYRRYPDIYEISR